MTRRDPVSGVALYGLIAGAVWLAWEIVKVPIIDRAPPATAVRVAPGSAQVLRRASEAELQAGRNQNAEALATKVLETTPFDARALRVLGLAVARSGDSDRADELLTLAGNWSLRDDPAHAWLIERRLRQGSYTSAFAHADTLARRRPGQGGPIFNLFATAALNDSRALVPLARLVGESPPWREAFLYYLLRRPDGGPVVLGMGIALEDTDGPLTSQELRSVYQHWFAENRFPAMSLLRQRLGRPGSPQALQDGDFSEQPENALLPFDWNLPVQPGIAGALIEDDVRPGDTALRVEYDGYASGVAAEQILMLEPGARKLTGEYRVEVSPDDSRLRWTITCIESGTAVGEWSVPVASATEQRWKRFEASFDIPAERCTTQRIRLESAPGDRRDFTVAWFDKFRVVS